MTTWKLPSLLIATALLAGCAAEPVTPSSESATTPTPTSASPTAVATPPVAATVTTPPSPVAPESEVTSPCTDTDLVLSHEPLESQGSEYRLVLRFENVTSQACSLQGYPGADIVDDDLPTVHVERRQQIAAPLLTLAPGDIATADLQASDVDRKTESPCVTWGQVVVIAPNTTQQRRLDVGMPTCSALISAVT
jgi:hypothetical protein